MMKNCPECGTAVHDELPGGLCPACLMAAAQKSIADEAGTTAMPTGLRTPSLSEIASLFPELEVMHMVGRGGMGAVYQVRQKNLDRVVALKVFLYRPDDPEFAARFQREARALAKLNHPNIVTVHDFGIRENMHFLIMEFIDGLNLRQLTEEERLTPEMALQMVPQLCEALQYAHDRGVIHRDIKPENLLLDTAGRINIADFGLAKISGSGSNGTLTRSQQVMGTYNYMAPEQRERPTEVDHRADIYSLGVVIYELLTGELPIGRFQPPSSKSAVNKELDEAVMRALEKEPDRRYQQASEFATGVESAGNYVAVPQPPVKTNLGWGNQVDKRGPRKSGTRFMFTMMAGREKKGNWLVGDPQLAFTMWGGTCLDLTHVQSNDVNLNVFTIMGGTEIIVPRGAMVDLDGFILMGASEDNTVSSGGDSKMHVRIRSWGAMAGCEVRTPKIVPAKKDKIDHRNSKMAEYRLPPEHDFSFSLALVFLYKMFAFLVLFAVPVIFLVGDSDYLFDIDTPLAGILAAITAGMLFSGLGYFRILVGAGPEETDEESLAEYYSATWIGTLIRSFALMFIFACPMLFVASAFDLNGEEKGLRLAGIICGVVWLALYSSADAAEDFFYGKRKD